MTQEAIPLKLNGSLYYTVTEPQVCLTKVVNLYGKMVEDAQICLRNHFAKLKVEEVRDFTSICAVVGSELRDRLEAFGVRIESVEIQDINYPSYVIAEQQVDETHTRI